uniref:Uncharacterized protein n=1 Tax=Anopheles atroparvus TaxID=41427 RepID=A0A182IUC8_ANOAO
MNRKKMRTLWNPAVLLAIGIALVYLVSIADVAQGQKLKCEQLEDRCIPLRHCPLYFNRVKAGEFLTNMDFRNQVVGLFC